MEDSEYFQRYYGYRMRELENTAIGALSEYPATTGYDQDLPKSREILRSSFPKLVQAFRADDDTVSETWFRDTEDMIAKHFTVPSGELSDILRAYYENSESMLGEKNFRESYVLPFLEGKFRLNYS